MKADLSLTMVKKIEYGRVMYNYLWLCVNGVKVCFAIINNSDQAEKFEKMLGPENIEEEKS